MSEKIGAVIRIRRWIIKGFSGYEEIWFMSFRLIQIYPPLPTFSGSTVKNPIGKFP